jgi:hypothetical protein
MLLLRRPILRNEQTADAAVLPRTNTASRRPSTHQPLHGTTKTMRAASFLLLMTTVLFLACLLSPYFLVIVSLEDSKLLSDESIRRTNSAAPEDPHYFPSTAFMLSSIQPSLCIQARPTSLPRIPRIMKPDYGDLLLVSLNGVPEWKRAVGKNEFAVAAQHRKKVLQVAEDLYVSSRYTSFEDLEFPRECVRPAWSYRSKPVCNAFHELPLEYLDYSTMTYLAHGYYRDSWLVEHPVVDDTTTATDRVVLKHLRLAHEFDARSMNKILTETVTMEVLSASPVISDLYGHCATSMFVERAYEITNDIVPQTAHQKWRGRVSHNKMHELEQNNQPFSFNNYTAIQKLDIAIQMAEGLAEMHGNVFGVIVNDDAHPDQWLVTDDNRVILNDMNNAVFLGWDYDKQDYCPYYSSYGGDYRAPEEYTDDGSYVDERYVTLTRRVVVLVESTT